MSREAVSDESVVVKLMRLWYLWLLLLGVGVAIGFGRSAGPTPDGVAPPSGAEATQDELRQKFETSLAKQEEAAQEPSVKSTDTVIEEHLARLDVLEEEGAPEPEESAALLSALGNLHKQKKQDYKTAAGYYEELIEKYPDWPGVNAVYHQLISCYTQLEDHVSLRLLYRKMVDVFPEGSNEHEYATAGLAGQV
jgi:hypothetical protein